MQNIIAQLCDNKIKYRLNEPMKLHTTFKTGGNAKLFVLPENESEIQKIIEICNSNKTEVFVIGNGSNLIVSDDGIKDKVVIHLGDNYSFIRRVDENLIEVAAGTKLIKVCKYALENSLSGLEFAYGIPGSAGGAAFMNAGAYGGEMKDVLVKCNHISMSGIIGSLENDELELSYRHSAYTERNDVITSIFLKLEKGKKEEISAKMKDFMSRRKEKQPLEYPSAGSVFKRPEGYFAGALVEQSGLKGKRIGGAMVSEKHAGFIINFDNATSTDIINLIEYCQKTVFDKFGIMLESEIKRV